MLKQTLLAGAVAALFAVPVSSVLALDAGDVVVKVGAATVSPNDDSSEVDTNFAGVLPESGVSIDGDTQLGLTLTYMMSKNLGLELLAATPFSTTITASGSIEALGDLGETKYLPPTLSLQYQFMPDAKVRPYAGVGLNYITFFDSNTVGELGDAGVSLELDDSFGLAGQLGVDVDMGNGWLINAAAWYIDANTTGTLRDGADELSVDVDINPWAFMLGFGKVF